MKRKKEVKREKGEEESMCRGTDAISEDEYEEEEEEKREKKGKVQRDRCRI